MNRNQAIYLTSALLVLLLSGGCGANVGEQVRRGTYPPNFNYIAGAELESTMGQLAAYASQLDRLLGDASTDPPREEVARLLVEMERVSEALGPGGWPSNHPRVSHNIENFRRDIVAARRAIEEDPPNFFRARTVTDSCTDCHQGS